MVIRTIYTNPRTLCLSVLGNHRRPVDKKRTNHSQRIEARRTIKGHQHGVMGICDWDTEKVIINCFPCGRRRWKQKLHESLTGFSFSSSDSEWAQCVQDIQYHRWAFIQSELSVKNVRKFNSAPLFLFLSPLCLWPGLGCDKIWNGNGPSLS